MKTPVQCKKKEHAIDSPDQTLIPNNFSMIFKIFELSNCVSKSETTSASNCKVIRDGEAGRLHFGLSQFLALKGLKLSNPKFVTNLNRP